MELTQEELTLVRNALIMYESNTSKAISQTESNIEGVETGRFCFWGKPDKEVWLRETKSHLEARKRILAQIVALKGKFEQ